jgi:hypothetical protein
MKTTRLSTKAIGSEEPIQQMTPSSQALDALSVEWMNLSPQRIIDQASATTQVLSEILERDEGSYHIRHWGINE